jgi:pSer/pThr/pTyr-binding forkhead associated (FHA) protein/cell division protein FtsL
VNKELQELTLSKLKEGTSTLLSKIHPYSGEDPRFRMIQEQLKAIESTALDEKIFIQLVNFSSTGLELVLEKLREHEFISSNCEFVISTQPKTESLEKSLLFPRLRLQTPDQKTSFFPLETDQKYIVGRASGCNLPIPDPYIFVSGYHSLIEYDRHSKAWIIRDNKSKNGTFINGIRLGQEEYRSLEPGDLIALGSTEISDKSPVYIFENPLEDSQNPVSIQPWRCFDFVYFLCDYGDLSILSQRKLFEEFNKLIDERRIYILINASGKNFSDVNNISSEIRDFNKKIRANINLSSIQFVYVFSEYLCSSTSRGDKNLTINREFNYFVRKLEWKLKTTKSQLICSQLNSKLGHIQKITEVVLGNENKISSNHSNAEHPSNDLSESRQSRSELKKLISRISSRKKDTFKAIDEYFTLSKANFFSIYYADSLPCKLKLFSLCLKSSIAKKNNKKQLRLILTLMSKYKSDKELQVQNAIHSYSTALTANEAMLDFCKEEVYQWADNIWSDIYSDLGAMSLEILHHEIIDILSEVPHIDIDYIQKSLSYQDFIIDCETAFADNFSPISDEITIKEVSAISYFLKKVRTQWMQFIFLFSFFSMLGIAGRRQIMQNIMAPVINLFAKAPMLSSLVLICLVLWAIRIILSIYQEELDSNRNKQANELRERLCKYYQNLTKEHLFKPVSIELKQRIEEEESRIERIENFLERQLKKGA